MSSEPNASVPPFPAPAPADPASPHPFAGIVAMDAERVIGRDGFLPWKVKEDLRWFRRITTGNTIVMGRTTWEGILAETSPTFAFPGRHTVVLSGRADSLGADGRPAWPGVAAVCGSMEDLLTRTRAGEFPGAVIIAGGARVFAAAMPYIGTVYLTRIHATHPGDTHMPPFERHFPHVREAETHAACTMQVMSRV